MMKSKIQRPETMVWIVAVAMAAIIGIAAIAAPPWPLGRPSHDEATIWVTALTGAGTLAAVAIALWLDANGQRQAERFRHDAIRPALTAKVTWGESSNLWINIWNWGQHAALNLRISVVIETPTREVIRLPLLHGEALSRPVVLAPYSQEASPDSEGKKYIGYYTADGISVEGNAGRIVFRYEDILGWTWENTTAVTFGSPSLSNGTNRQHMDMGEPRPIPRRLAGWPGESGGEVIVK